MTARRTAIQSLAEAVMSFEIETIPEDVLSLAKRCLVDVCGVTLAGSKTESAKLLFATAAEIYGIGNCDIVGTSHRLNAPGAAFANGAAAHALDLTIIVMLALCMGQQLSFQLSWLWRNNAVKWVPNCCLDLSLA